MPAPQRVLVLCAAVALGVPSLGACSGSSSGAGRAVASAVPSATEVSPDPSSQTAAAGTSAPALPSTPEATRVTVRTATTGPRPSGPAPGGALVAGGGWSGAVVGPYTCTVTGGGTVMRDARAVSTGLGLTLTARGRQVVSGALLGDGRTFGGASVTGLPGSLTISGGTALVKAVSIPSLAGGTAVVLNGVVPCGA